MNYLVILKKVYHMITIAKLVNNPKWLDGMTYTVRITDRFGRSWEHDNIVGTVHREDLKEPFKHIIWTNRYEVRLIGATVETVRGDRSEFFNNLEDAMHFLFDHNDKYVGEIYQRRVLTNGVTDVCVVTYIRSLYHVVVN